MNAATLTNSRNGHRPAGQQSQGPEPAAFRLPSAIEAESQVVGGCLIDPQQLEKIANLIKADDFVDPAHRATMGVLFDMRRIGTPIDVSTVRQQLASMPSFPSKASVYLAEVGRNCATAAHVPYHANLVAEAYRKRRLVLLATDAASAAASARKSDEILADLSSGVEDLRREAHPTANEIRSLPLCEFMAQDHRVECLAGGLVVTQAAGVIAAKSKGQKTTVACDLALSIATGTPALGRFHVDAATPCGIISGESGAATLEETFGRIAATKGVDWHEVRTLHVSTEVPRLLTLQGVKSVRRFIERHDLRQLFVDPTYLAFAGVEDSQLSKMAEVLGPLNDIIDETGCGITLVHHNRKTTPSPYGEPTLEEITGAGLAQWARWWLLLNKRREWCPTEGRHWLWFCSGSSAGFGSRQWLNIREGQRSDPGGRVWELEFAEPAAGQQREREQLSADKEAAKLESERRAVCQVLAAHPAGMSWSKALRLANVSSRRWDLVKECMIDERDVEETSVTISNHKTPQPGVKLASANAP